MCHKVWGEQERKEILQKEFAFIVAELVFSVYSRVSASHLV